MPLNHASIYSELTDRHFSQIGKIVVECSNIEFLLGVLLSKILMTPEFLARSYTDRMSAVKIQEAIKEGVEIHKKLFGSKIISDQKLDAIIALNNRITKFRAKRNKFAHFCWCRENDNEIFGTNFSGGVPSRKKERSESVIFTVKELEEFYNEVYKVVDELSHMVNSLPKFREEDIPRMFPQK